MSTRVFIAALILAAGIGAASAIPTNQQIIIFGGHGSSASGGSGLLPCGTGAIDLSAGCTVPVALGLIP